MRYVLCAALAVLAAACGDNGASDDVPPPAPPITTVALEPLAGTDVQGQLDGELGCSFTVGDDVLIIAMGNVDPTDVSEALAKREGRVEELDATAPGGYDGMVEGASFSGGDLSIEVQTDLRNETGNEQVAYAARLTVSQTDGALRTYNGAWTCGP